MRDLESIWQPGNRSVTILARINRRDLDRIAATLKRGDEKAFDLAFEGIVQEFRNELMQQVITDHTRR